MRVLVNLMEYDVYGFKGGARTLVYFVNAEFWLLYGPKPLMTRLLNYMILLMTIVVQVILPF